MQINWAVVGTVAAIAFQTVALASAVVSTASATQTELVTLKTTIVYMQRDVQRLTDKVFP
jgi:hypothetical protein